MFKKRRKWSPDEEKVLREELDIIPNMHIPTRKFCEQVLTKYKHVFVDKDKADIQDKYRRIVRRISST